MKHKHKIALLFFIGILAYLIFVSSRVPDLTEKQALLTIFGNYNEANQTSIWKNMSIPPDEENSYFSTGVGIVSVAFFQPYKEGGKKKFFLLTKTIPIDVPFECHACSPLLSGFVFSRDKNAWRVESQQRFLGYDGEYGIVPEARLIQIGSDKFGLLLAFKYVSSEMTDVENEFLVPYKQNITKAYSEMVYYNNFERCWRFIPCAAYTAKIDFDRSTKQEFFRLKVSKFGTDNDPKRSYKAVPVDEEAVYEFQNGKYVQVSRSGQGPVNDD